MHGQQNDKYTEMHGQQNDKYTEMHGQQNIKNSGVNYTITTIYKALTVFYLHYSQKPL